MALTTEQSTLIQRVIDRVNPLLDLEEDLWRDLETFNIQDMFNQMQHADIVAAYPSATHAKIVASINLYKAILVAMNTVATGDSPTHNADGARSALLLLRR